MTPTYHMANYRISPQIGFNFDELVIDNFAGGGGASTGIEAALGRAIDIAINHDQDAIAMHEINHPQTRHYCESVWDVNPREVCAGRPVGLAVSRQGVSRRSRCFLGLHPAQCYQQVSVNQTIRRCGAGTSGTPRRRDDFFQRGKLVCLQGAQDIEAGDPQYRRGYLLLRSAPPLY